MGPGGALLVGAVAGGMMGAAMAGPGPRQNHTTTTVYVNQGGYQQPYQQPGYYVPPPPPVMYQQPQVVYQQPQVVYQQPAPEPFSITGLSVSEFVERGNGVVYYKVVVSSEDLGAGRPWAVWRRYKQFDELRESVGQYVATYKEFPAKSGLFSVFSKHSPGELEVRRKELEDWLREVVGKARAGGVRVRLQNVLNVFLEFRMRHGASAALANDGAGGAGGALHQGGGMMTPNNVGGFAPVQQQQQQQQQQVQYVPEAEVQVQPQVRPVQGEVPVFVPEVGKQQSGGDAPVFVPQATVVANGGANGAI